MKRIRTTTMTWAAPAISAVLLVGVAMEWRWLHSPTSDTQAYQRRVARAAGDLPEQVGPWKARDTQVPQAAIDMLKPNVMLSKLWVNQQTGKHVSMLVVQCQDARHLLGHYPPVCYVGQGWSVIEQKPRTWTTPDFDIAGTEYTFGRTVLEGPSRLIIQNFMVLPNGRFAPDMDEVDKVASDRQLKFLGAAQVQLVYDDRTSPEEREEVLEKLVTAYRPLLESILSGVEE